MTPSTDLAEPNSAALAAREEALAAQSADELAGEKIQVPLVKIVQGTTKNPPDEARPGEFFNSVTDEAYGKEIELVIVKFFRGRFYEDKSEGRTYPAGPDPVVPDFWPEEFRGKVFADLDEAEERFKERVNDGEVEWGSGPPIQTTYNYLGFIIGHEGVPVRLSLKSAATKTAEKLNTLLRTRPPHWSQIIKVTTSQEDGAKGTYYVPRVSFGGATPAELRALAVELVTEVNRREIVPVGDGPEAPPAAVKPAGDGLLGQD